MVLPQARTRPGRQDEKGAKHDVGKERQDPSIVGLYDNAWDAPRQACVRLDDEPEVVWLEEGEAAADDGGSEEVHAHPEEGSGRR